MMTVRASSIAAVILAATIIAGCGGKPGKDNGNAAASPGAGDPADNQTTSTVSAGQLDFFTERYINADERLLRRQNRIEEELSGSATAEQS